MSDQECLVFTDSLHGILKEGRFTKNQRQFIYDKIEHYIKQYKAAHKDVGPESAAFSFHNMLDEQIESHKNEELFKRSSCRKGCSACCRKEVAISMDEAALLYGYMKEENIEVNIDRLRKQTKAKSYVELDFKDTACVFLGNNGECRVYKHRPASCRKYFVLSLPELCVNAKDTVERFISYDSEILTMAILNGSSSDSMAKFLLEKLNVS